MLLSWIVCILVQFLWLKILWKELTRAFDLEANPQLGPDSHGQGFLCYAHLWLGYRVLTFPLGAPPNPHSQLNCRSRDHRLSQIPPIFLAIVPCTCTATYCPGFLLTHPPTLIFFNLSASINFSILLIIFFLFAFELPPICLLWPGNEVPPNEMQYSACDFARVV